MTGLAGGAGGMQRPSRSSMPQLGANGSLRGTGEAAGRSSPGSRSAISGGSAGGNFSSRFGGGNRSTAAASSNRSTTTANGNRGATGNASGNSQYARNGNNGAVGTANTNTGTVGSGNGNSGVVNNGNVGSGNVNTGNVVAGNDVNVAVDNGWNGWEDYPAGAYATGVAVGTTTAAAATRSYYSSLPPTCSPYVWNSMNYYSCGGTWYQTQYQGGQVVYVAVSDPTKSK